jgi:hypothetical protein
VNRHLACLSLALAACSGQTANGGLGEPLQVSGQAQFIAGPLPGTVPPDAGGDAATATADASPDGAALAVTSVTLTNPFIVSGIAGTGVSGLVSSDAVAVGIAIAHQGTGYWVVPTQGQDIQFPGQRDFSFTASFNPTDAPGNLDLRVVAIGPSGSAGLEANAPVCLESRIPDYGHACVPTRTVPAAVFTLQWDSPFDLDLTVITPSGRNVNPKTDPITAPIDAGTTPLTGQESVGLYGGAVGIIDRDSIGNCVVDGWRQEDLVFQDYPETGPYDIYADPFASCGQPAVRFTFTIYQPGADGNLHATFTRSGELLSNQTTGGAAPDGGSVAGLFVAEKEFE